jgi:hypothetical protein
MADRSESPSLLLSIPRACEMSIGIERLKRAVAAPDRLGDAGSRVLFPRPSIEKLAAGDEKESALIS